MKNIVSDGALWGIAMHFTGAEGTLQKNANVFEENEAEIVLQLPSCDYLVRVVEGDGYYVQSSSETVLYKVPSRCPNLPEEFEELLYSFAGITIPSNLAPVERWQEFVAFVNELDDDDKEEFENLICELW